MSQERTETLLDIGGFVGTPLGGWPTHGEPAPDRVDSYRPDPLTHNIVDALCDGLLEPADRQSVTDTDWQSASTVRPELFWVQRWVGGEWRWREAVRPNHFSQFVSTHRVDPDEQGWRVEGGEHVASLPEWELEQLGAMPNYSLTESLTRL